METSKAMAISIVAFLLSAGLTAQWSSPRAGARQGVVIGWNRTAHAYAPACFSRCREGEATCQSGCWGNYHDCQHSGAAAEQCGQSRDRCVRRCVTHQSSCMQGCL